MSNPNPLNQIQPGQRLPGAGRPPKEFSMTEAMKEIALEVDPVSKIERYKKVLEKAFTLAERGDGDMIKYIINRFEGVPKGEGGTTAVQVNNFTSQDIEAGFKIFYRNNRQRAKELMEEVENENTR